MSSDDTDINDDDERMNTMLMKSSTVTGGVQRKEHTVEPKPTASSAQKFFLSKGINDQENGSIPDMENA